MKVKICVYPFTDTDQVPRPWLEHTAGTQLIFTDTKMNSLKLLILLRTALFCLPPHVFVLNSFFGSEKIHTFISPAHLHATGT